MPVPQHKADTSLVRIVMIRLIFGDVCLFASSSNQPDA
jgi:hypothetical protein